MDYRIEYYQKDNGTIPVVEFLTSLHPKMRAKAYHDIELLQQFGPKLKEPHVKPIKGMENRGLYELRIRFSSDISRIFYFSYEEKAFVLLHGFIKKTGKTPEREICRVRKYKKDYERRCKHE